MTVIHRLWWVFLIPLLIGAWADLAQAQQVQVTCSNTFYRGDQKVTETTTSACPSQRIVFDCPGDAEGTGHCSGDKYINQCRLEPSLRSRAAWCPRDSYDSTVSNDCRSGWRWCALGAVSTPPGNNPPGGGGGGGGSGGSGGDPYLREHPYTLELHTARSPATGDGATPPNEMGQYKVKAAEEGDPPFLPVYTYAEAMHLSKIVVSGIDACGNETLSFCGHLADAEDKGTVGLLWYDLLKPIAGRRGDDWRDLDTMALGYRVLDAARNDDVGLCAIDVDRDPDDIYAHPYFGATWNTEEKNADTWRLARLESYNLDGAIPRDGESRLILRFSEDPGETFNRCMVED